MSAVFSGPQWDLALMFGVRKKQDGKNVQHEALEMDVHKPIYVYVYIFVS